MHAVTLHRRGSISPSVASNTWIVGDPSKGVFGFDEFIDLQSVMINMTPIDRTYVDFHSYSIISSPEPDYVPSSFPVTFQDSVMFSLFSISQSDEFQSFMETSPINLENTESTFNMLTDPNMMRLLSGHIISQGTYLGTRLMGDTQRITGRNLARLGYGQSDWLSQIGNVLIFSAVSFAITGNP